MANNRDDFSKATTEIMAKRVGYLCSNPTCRQLTIGANEIENKATSIGIGAHITAASSRGPRFDENITSDQRGHINNGIWLCSNCAKLIDTDITKYTVEILQTWKQQAEEETRLKLNGEYRNLPAGSPFLEADLIWHIGGRSNRGYSDKNPIEILNGNPHFVIGYKPIIHWALDWQFSFVIFNNSTYPAYNVQIESIGEVHFTYIDQLAKINNLPSLQNLDLKAKYEDYVEGDYTAADEIMKLQIPMKFNELTLRIKYLDDNRNEQNTFVKFKDGEIINRKE
jgi:hypothetical protein